ncbi:MAG: 50S ribosomal protein L21 [Deltaproteobacteria bacterium]|nr:50S ribosomal protein L21 [Deltaproteobacteria bacterium]
MYAIIATGGKQYRVTEGETLRVEKLVGDKGQSVSFDKVLLVSDGENLTIGRPYVENALVTAGIVEQDKAKKVLVFKTKRRKRYRRLNGHRQPFTSVRIQKIDTGLSAAPVVPEGAEAVQVEA